MLLEYLAAVGIALLAQKVIGGSFYLLFFSVPLFFHTSSHELFEFNKMMLTYAVTVVIAAAWAIKLVASHVSLVAGIKRTPLDIPIFLLLGSRVLATIFSIDSHVSIWGYYTRFNEGLLSTVSYLILYYAAVANLNRSHVNKILLVSFASAAIVSIYGAFEHFGVSPSCGFITGSWNVDCWVQDVKNRVFATLGQPNWMAAYLNVVVLAALGFLAGVKSQSASWRTKGISYIILASLFFSALLFTKSRSGLAGLMAGLAVLSLFYLGSIRKRLIVVLFIFLLPILVFGLPFSQTEKYSQPAASSEYLDVGISESGDIRKVVWTGAIRVWQRYPIFGSGVETFAYSYYQDRPVEHNMLSEWDFLYNKAHNEYLNLLATTGTVGLLSYLSFLGVFSFWFVRKADVIWRRSPHQPLITNDYFVPALFAAWVSILVTNFFGFSVVIIGLYFYLLPAFCFLLVTSSPRAGDGQAKDFSPRPFTLGKVTLISLISLMGLFLEWRLFSLWRADAAFAYGKNLDSIQQYVAAYPYLMQAVEWHFSEPTFREELALNEAILATAIWEQINSASESAVASLSAQEKLALKHPLFDLSTSDFISQAVAHSNSAVTASPYSLPFWKGRTRVFIQLASIDPSFDTQAIEAIRTAAALAPTDAKVHYNYGYLLGKTGERKDAIKILEETVAMKPDYRDAYFSLGTFYDQTGEKDKARETMRLILTRIGPDEEAKAWLERNP